MFEIRHNRAPPGNIIESPSMPARRATNALDNPESLFSIRVEVVTKLRPDKNPAMQTHQRDPFRLPARPAKRFQCSLSPAQVLDHGSPNGPLSPRLRFCQIGPRRQGSFSAASRPGLLRADPGRRAVYEGKGGFRVVWTGRKVPFRSEAGCRFLELLGVALVQLLRGI